MELEGNPEQEGEVGSPAEVSKAPGTCTAAAPSRVARASLKAAAPTLVALASTTTEGAAAAAAPNRPVRPGRPRYQPKERVLGPAPATRRHE